MTTPIFLIGYMGSGKTTLGRALAAELGATFIDLDFFIEQRFRTTVAEFFASKGEEAFRRAEAAALREVGEWENVVVACGGGTPCFNDNIDYMNSAGLTICLHASDATLLRRLTRRRSKRPLLSGKTDEEILEMIRTHQAARLPFYSKAQLSVNSDSLDHSSDMAAPLAEQIKTIISK